MSHSPARVAIGRLTSRHVRVHSLCDTNAINTDGSIRWRPDRRDAKPESTLSDPALEISPENALWDQ
jgi:hypothetical protein